MTKFLHSRYCLIVTALMAIACALLYYFVGVVAHPYSDEGIVAHWGTQWISASVPNAVAGLVLNVGIALLLGYLNRVYNLLRNLTWLQASMFLAMQLAVPSLVLTLTPGLILAVVVLCSLFIMYANYGNPEAQRPVFLVFLMYSACMAFDYSFAIYMLAAVVIAVQMRILSLRTVLAMLMGVLTPWIIYLGFGIVKPDQLQLPEFYQVNSVLGARSVSWLIGVAAFTAFVGVSAWVQNFMKILSYNAQSRANIGSVTLLMLVTIVAGACDFTHIFVFLPLLNCCVALMLGHTFGVVYRFKKSFVAILSLMALYFGLFAWRTISCVF